MDLQGWAVRAETKRFASNKSSAQHAKCVFTKTMRCFLQMEKNQNKSSAKGTAKSEKLEQTKRSLVDTALDIAEQWMMALKIQGSISGQQDA